jgi:hypothetical protein
MIAESWRARWDYIVPFLALSADLRRIVYTTDESVKALAASTVVAVGVRLRGGRGRPPSEAQDVGLCCRAACPAEGLESRAPVAEVVP